MARRRRIYAARAAASGDPRHVGRQTGSEGAQLAAADWRHRLRRREISSFWPAVSAATLGSVGYSLAVVFL